MKNAIFACLMAFGLNAAAQCPINDVLTTRDPQNITALIENNTDCFKQAITQNLEYSQFKTYLDYIYNNASGWVYHAYPEKEQLFAKFYEKWGKDYPAMGSPLPSSPEFYKDMNTLMASDPKFFQQTKDTKVPLKYMQWLYVRRMNERYGAQTVLNLTNAVGKLANLHSTANYTAFAGN